MKIDPRLINLKPVKDHEISLIGLIRKTVARKRQTRSLIVSMEATSRRFDHGNLFVCALRSGFQPSCSPRPSFLPARVYPRFHRFLNWRHPAAACGWPAKKLCLF